MPTYRVLHLNDGPVTIDLDKYPMIKKMWSDEEFPPASSLPRAEFPPIGGLEGTFDFSCITPAEFFAKDEIA